MHTKVCCIAIRPSNLNCLSSRLHGALIVPVVEPSRLLLRPPEQPVVAGGAKLSPNNLLIRLQLN